MKFCAVMVLGVGLGCFGDGGKTVVIDGWCMRHSIERGKSSDSTAELKRKRINNRLYRKRCQRK